MRAEKSEDVHVVCQASLHRLGSHRRRLLSTCQAALMMLTGGRSVGLLNKVNIRLYRPFICVVATSWSCMMVAASNRPCSASCLVSPQGRCDSLPNGNVSEAEDGSAERQRWISAAVNVRLQLAFILVERQTLFEASHRCRPFRTSAAVAHLLRTRRSDRTVGPYSSRNDPRR